MFVCFCFVLLLFFVCVFFSGGGGVFAFMLPLAAVHDEVTIFVLNLLTANSIKKSCHKTDCRLISVVDVHFSMIP